jgi:hypothetical protein
MTMSGAAGSAGLQGVPLSDAPLSFVERPAVIDAETLRFRASVAAGLASGVLTDDPRKGKHPEYLRPKGESEMRDARGGCPMKITDTSKGGK